MDDDTKVCAGCTEAKPLSEFGKLKRNHDGYRNTCKVCRRYERAMDSDEPYVPPQQESRGDPFAIYGGRRQYRHRITDDEFDALWESQDGQCGICFVPLTLDNYTIDHDHKCPCHSRNGRLCGKCRRGLLCHRCNLGISHFNDDAQTIRNAADWVGRANLQDL